MAVRRFFLVPIHVTPGNINLYDPEYMKELGEAATAGKICCFIGKRRGNDSFLRSNFIVSVDANSERDFQVLDGLADVVEITADKITQQSIKDRLFQLGVDMSGIGTASRAEDVERRVVHWLLEQEKTLTELFAGR